MGDPRIDLTDRQRAELLKVFGHFAPLVERVDVDGSRARGDAPPGSDVDLIVAGKVDHRTLRRIVGALDDSYLSILADVAAYAQVQPGPFADAVARTARALFTADDLAAAPPFRPVDGRPEWYAPVPEDQPGSPDTPLGTSGRSG